MNIVWDCKPCKLYIPVEQHKHLLVSIHTICTINLQLESFCWVWVGWQNVGLLLYYPNVHRLQLIHVLGYHLVSNIVQTSLLYLQNHLIRKHDLLYLSIICLYMINTISLTLAYHFLRFCIAIIWHDVLLSILKWVDLMVRFWKKQPWWAVCSPCFLGQKSRCVAVIIVLRS